MSAVRPHEVKHLLHKEVFHPKKERLIGFTKVSKTEPGFLSKENVHYLCSTITIERPQHGFISRYRKKDSGDGYEERRRWPLEALKKVDGHSTASDCLLFDLSFDRPFKFESPTAQDKEEFLTSIASMCSKYLTTPSPPFVNVTGKIQTSLPDVDTNLRRQLENTKEQLAERGDKLNQLSSATADMADNAQSFSQNAKKLSDQYR